MRAYLKDTSLAHLEMMQALAGKRDELIKQRQMEGLFNTLRGRPATLIFTHEQGAAWDVSRSTRGATGDSMASCR